MPIFFFKVQEAKVLFSNGNSTVCDSSSTNHHSSNKVVSRTRVINQETFPNNDATIPNARFRLSMFSSLKRMDKISMYDIYFSAVFLNDILKVAACAETFVEENKILDQNLASFGLERVETPENGDCLFHAVLFSVINQVPEAHEHLCNVGLTTQNATDNIQQLRKLMVQEWMLNKQRYKNYLDENKREEFEQNSERYLKCGEYAGDFGDLMITAIANVLSLPIVVFTSTPIFPVITITPTSLKYNIKSENKMLTLAFRPSGSGHYSGVVYKPAAAPNTTVTERKKLKNMKPCNWGRNSKENK